MLTINFKRVSSFLKCPLLASFALFGIYFDQALARVSGAGALADDMLDPIGLFSKFVNAGCIVIGVGFIFASIVKYFEHRRSPLMVPISTVIFLLIAGIVLLAIPVFSYFYTQYYGIVLR